MTDNHRDLPSHVGSDAHERFGHRARDRQSWLASKHKRLLVPPSSFGVGSCHRAHAKLQHLLCFIAGNTLVLINFHFAVLCPTLRLDLAMACRQLSLSSSPMILAHHASTCVAAVCAAQNSSPNSKVRNVPMMSHRDGLR